MRGALGNNTVRLLLAAIGQVAYVILAFASFPIPITNFLGRIEHLVGYGEVFIGIYLLLFLLHCALSEKHQGWKWVALVMGSIGAILGGYIGHIPVYVTDRLLDIPTPIVTIEIFLRTTMMAGFCAIIGLAIIVIARWVVKGLYWAMSLYSPQR